MLLNKIIIWGFELHNHTHSYIHNAFYTAFKYLQYNVYWYNQDGYNNYPNENSPDNFDNSLFIVVGVESRKLPINESSFYIWHTSSCPIDKEFNGTDYKIPKCSIYKNITGIPKQNLLKLHTLWKPCNNPKCNDINNGCNNWSHDAWESKIKFYDNNNYYYYNCKYNIIYMPWATDLLPSQIQHNINNLENIKSYRISYFIGMELPHWTIFKNELLKYGINYINYGGTFDKHSENNKSVEENMRLIQSSIIAPSLQDEHQIIHEYVPCRIFKNISYGKMGLTNNITVNTLFDNKLIYSNNISELVKKGLEFENDSNKYAKIKLLMEEVRDHHTYINRINFILDFLNKFKNININKLTSH
jgi:hypothetical protein